MTIRATHRHGLRGRLAAIAAGLAALAVLSGCGSSSSGHSAPAATPLVVAYDPATGAEIVTTSQEAYGDGAANIFGVERATEFSGAARPRLTDQLDNGPTGFIATSGINGPATPGVALDAGYEGTIGQGSPSIRPLPTAPIEGAIWQPRYDDSPSVRLSYEQEDLTQVIQNILGGILGQNFIIGESVTGTVTFRSNTRFSPAQLVQILADIVAREGYVMQYINGVYHVGTVDELAALAVARGQSSLDGDGTRTLPVPGTVAIDEIVSLLQALVPPSVQVAAVPDSRNIVLRGDPTQFASVAALVSTLVDTGVAEQSVAIIPLRQNDPEAVAEELLGLYAEQGISGITAIPLSARRALLVAAPNPSALSDLRGLAQALDVDMRDSVSLRVIQLAHAPAAELAEQINQAFGAAPSAQPEATSPEQSAILAAAAQRGVTSAGGGEDGDVALGALEASAPVASPRIPPEEGVSVVADPRNNALLVRSTFEQFQRIQRVVSALDVPSAQVVIEATIVEVDISDELAYGVQAFLEGAGISVRSSSGTAGPADGGGQGFSAVLGGSFGGVDAGLVISALQSVTNVRVISSPYVTVVDGATSELSVGDQIPFVTASQSSSSDGNVVVTQEIETVDVGVILNVTPRIRPDNSVLLEVEQTVSSARQANTTAGENPVIAQRSVTSQVLVQSGYSVLLGGLITERTNTGEGGVPGLRSIPGVGGLFGQTRNLQARSELLIMITPRVVRNSDSLSAITEQLRWSTSVN